MGVVNSEEKCSLQWMLIVSGCFGMLRGVLGPNFSVILHDLNFSNSSYFLPHILCGNLWDLLENNMFGTNEFHGKFFVKFWKVLF